MQVEGLTDQEKSRYEKLKKIEELGINPYPHKFDVKNTAEGLQEKYKDLPSGEETKDVAHVAGRIRANRNSGMFIDLVDGSGKIQVFSHEDHLDEMSKKLLPLLDIGDVVGIKGTVRRTKRNELSIAAEKITILSKALKPLPEKFHGLKDVEQRFRERSVDFIMNEESRSKILMKSRMTAFIRSHLTKQGFLEMETPMLHPILGGANARPFVTHHNALDMDLYLRIAPELYLKKLLIGGFEKIFELNRDFRNEGISVKHNPEFTKLEIYWAYADYRDMMRLLEEMLRAMVKELTGNAILKFRDYEIDFESPFKVVKVVDIIKEKTGLDFNGIKSDEDARKALKTIGLEAEKTWGWGKCVEVAFEEKVEASIINPTYVIDFPKEVSPLTKEHREDERLTERADLYCNGWELGPIYSELSDPRDQRSRFEAQMAAREQGDEEAQMMDESFLSAMEQGMPPAGGLGLGTDRMAILLTNAESIREVIAFPTLRPIDENKPKDKDLKKGK